MINNNLDLLEQLMKLQAAQPAISTEQIMSWVLCGADAPQEEVDRLLTLASEDSNEKNPSTD